METQYVDSEDGSPSKSNSFYEKRAHTLQLIRSVKERPILYDLNYENRGKQNKEQAWQEVANIIGDTNVEETKKKWKNIRDRYVKVRNLRKRHFESLGCEANAPTYKFSEELDFLKNYSKKETEYPVSDVISNLKDLEPDLLVFTEPSKEDDRKLEYFDCSLQFLEELQKHSILYNPNMMEDRIKMKYWRSKAWGEISNTLNSKFSKGTLRDYFASLTKKFQYYKSLDLDPIGNNKLQNFKIFESMEFLTPFLIEGNSTICRSEIECESESIEFIEELEEIECTADEKRDENCEPDRIEYVITDNDCGALPYEGHSSEDEITSHKTIVGKNFSDCNTTLKRFCDSSESPRPHKMAKYSNSQSPVSSKEDEFDFFGKKVAYQLRNIARKSKSSAREVEIKCLELLMQAEQKLDSSDS